jgi:hypothetical protein
MSGKKETMFKIADTGERVESQPRCGGPEAFTSMAIRVPVSMVEEWLFKAWQAKSVV